jgi:thiamine-phosphate diphosphorylase
MKGVCLILDQDWMRGDPDQIMRAAHAGGVAFFQYRNKNGSRAEIYETAARLARLAQSLDCIFIVNDHVDIALAVNASGVHVGQDDLPIVEARALLGSRIVGISTHNEQEAREAEAAGADYIGFGSMFPTGSKDNAVVRGAAGLRVVRNAVKLPIIAIGGITAHNMGEAIRAGADGAAVISAILSAADIEQASRELVRNAVENIYHEEHEAHEG